MVHSCECCRETKTSQREVELSCADGSKVKHVYTVVEACRCTPARCVEATRRRWSLIRNVFTNIYTSCHSFQVKSIGLNNSQHTQIRISWLIVIKDVFLQNQPLLCALCRWWGKISPLDYGLRWPWEFFLCWYLQPWDCFDALKADCRCSKMNLRKLDTYAATIF